MTSAVPGASGDFFAELRAEHAAAEARLKDLDRVARGSSDLEPASAPGIVAEVLRYFASEGARHEEHEERTLFPRLRDRAEFRQILSALEFQHRMNAVEGRALADCAASFAPEKARELRRLAGRYADAQRGHMIAEERALFDLAATRLPPSELLAMSLEMQQRRLASAARR